MIESWWAFANCKGMDPGQFYPERNDPTKAARAIQVCQGCVVRDECLEDALADHQFGIYGVRGGLAEGTRKQLARTRRRLERMVSA